MNPPGRSALEVFRNYRQALANAGFKTLFQCEGKAGCGTLFHQAIYPISKAFTRSQQAQFALSGVTDQYFLSARLGAATGRSAFVSLYVATDKNEAGVYQGANRVMTLLQVVRVRAMQTGQVTVDAAALASGLKRNGHIALGCILTPTERA
ncbi:hypothetical protein BMS3Bbin13_02511 [bacterium BMS3Bbin13]|nr:hypothetical protein BMS3Bbin13_02511 [bacterium BMS3Bbin13]